MMLSQAVSGIILSLQSNTDRFSGSGSPCRADQCSERVGGGSENFLFNEGVSLIQQNIWEITYIHHTLMHKLQFCTGVSCGLIPALISTLWAVGCQLRMPTRLEWPSSLTTGSVRGEVSPLSGISQIYLQTQVHGHAVYRSCYTTLRIYHVVPEWKLTRFKGGFKRIQSCLLLQCCKALPWHCSPQSHWRWCCRCGDKIRCPGPDLCGRTQWGRTCRYAPSAQKEGCWVQLSKTKIIQTVLINKAAAKGKEWKEE